MRFQNELCFSTCLSGDGLAHEFRTTIILGPIMSTLHPDLIHPSFHLPTTWLGSALWPRGALMTPWFSQVAVQQQSTCDTLPEQSRSKHPTPWHPLSRTKDATPGPSALDVTLIHPVPFFYSSPCQSILPIIALESSGSCSRFQSLVCFVVGGFPRIWGGWTASFSFKL